MSGWDRLVEERIQRAIEEGAFDALPGTGRPPELDEKPFEDPEMRLAHRVLRSSGYTLPWIAERREIEIDIKTARRCLARSWSHFQRIATSNWDDHDWRRALDVFRRQVELINKRIGNYNLIVPVLVAQRRLLKVEDELGEIMSSGSDEDA